MELPLQATVTCLQDIFRKPLVEILQELIVGRRKSRVFGPCCRVGVEGRVILKQTMTSILTLALSRTRTRTSSLCTARSSRRWKCPLRACRKAGRSRHRRRSSTATRIYAASPRRIAAIDTPLPFSVSISVNIVWSVEEKHSLIRQTTIDTPLPFIREKGAVKRSPFHTILTNRLILDRKMLELTVARDFALVANKVLWTGGDKRSIARLITTADGATTSTTMIGRCRDIIVVCRTRRVVWLVHVEVQRSYRQSTA
jgi:hypothetical protein